MTQQAVFDLAGRVVVVTGGGRGVGRGITESFLAARATVVIVSRTEPDPVVHVGDTHAAYVRADVREPDEVERAITGVAGLHGRLDVVVNNAGGSPPADTATASPRFFDSVVRLNLVAPFYVARAANAIMQAQDDGGVILNIGSVAASRPAPGSAAYGAAKAGLLHLTRTLAVEWAPKVRVNCVTPGMVRTEQSELHYGDAAGIAAVAATVPLGRLAEPSDIGAACVFLASDAASYASGSELVLDGGGERPAFLAAAEQAR